jgi:tetrahydromethanopterin S-methyltransferase subunit C
MKYGAILSAAICELAAVYSVYLAFTLYEGAAPFILRLICALVIGYFGYACYRDLQKSREVLVRKWYEKDRVKGVYLYALTKGVIGYGIPVGFVAWVMRTDFEFTNPLWVSALLTLIPYSLGGIIIALYIWSQLKEDAEKSGLCC